MPPAGRSGRAWLTPARICIYGASYGGYAALMGVGQGTGALPLRGRLRRRLRPADDVHGRRHPARVARAQTYLQEWIGYRADTGGGIAGQPRPTQHQGAGIPGRGWRGRARAASSTPSAWRRRLKKAGRAGGNPVLPAPKATVSIPLQHRREFYTQLLAFLSRNLGGAAAQQPPAGSARKPTRTQAPRRRRVRLEGRQPGTPRHRRPQLTVVLHPVHHPLQQRRGEEGEHGAAQADPHHQPEQVLVLGGGLRDVAWFRLPAPRSRRACRTAPPAFPRTRWPGTRCPSSG